MRSLRNRARVFAVVALTWHVVTIAAVSTALSCDQGPAFEHHDMAGHEGMGEDCPMQKKQPACPLHASKHGTHDCDCPTLGCSQTDAGFMALFGAVGVLPTATSTHALIASGDAAAVKPASAIRLAAVPLAPPPRA